MGTPENNSDTFEQRVNGVVSQFTTDENGKLSLPDGVEVDEATLYAAKAEKRRRDTQAAFTQTQQENKRLAKENEVLASNWEKDAIQQMSAAEQTELEELKSSDPDAWHEKMIALKEAKKQEFAERRADVTKTVSAEEELAMREQELEIFNSENPDFAITDEVIENDIPPRITKKLEAGTISFTEFLTEVKTYLSKGKTLQQPEKPNESKDLSSIPGGREPSPEAKRKASASDYNSEVY